MRPAGVRLALALLALGGGPSPARATVLATHTFTAVDPASGGEVAVISTVRDDFFGDPTRLHFDYQVLNLSFDPQPGTSNGLSGFQVLFAGAVPGVADQYAPAGWTFNCCGQGPPFGAEADIRDSEGFGVRVGGIGNFGFSAPAGTPWTDVDQGSWAHSWALDLQLNVFPLSDPVSGLGLIVPVPEPAAGLLLLAGLGLLGGVRRRRGRP